MKHIFYLMLFFAAGGLSILAVWGFAYIIPTAEICNGIEGQ